MKTTTKQQVLTASLAMCFLVGLTACKTTRQVHEDQQSGFLDNHYSLLQKGEKGEANYIYINTNANWGKYTKVWIKPIELWKSDDPDSRLNKMDEETQKELTQMAYNALYEGLTNNFQIVDQGGPDVLIIHAAITDGRPSKPVVNFVSSVYLPLKAISFGKRLITGTDIGVGYIQVEAEFLDGETGQIVCAAMDARAGTKALRTKFNSTWGDARLAFEWWGQRIDKRLMLFKQSDFGTANL
jgi:hypothetical protein